VITSSDKKYFLMNLTWNKKKDKIKQKFTGVTNKDLLFKLGKEDEMVRKLRNKLGKTDEEILRIIVEY
jgi:hypothetical protein